MKEHSPGHWEHVAVVEEDVDKLVVYVQQLCDPVGPGVHDHVDGPVDHKVPDAVLKVHPVLAVETLERGRFS